MKRFSRTGMNTRIFSAPGMTMEEWNGVKEDVTSILQGFALEGYEVQSLRWLNEINEVTPCNVDRNHAFIRVLGIKNIEE